MSPLIMLIALALGACATGPRYSTDNVNQELTPRAAVDKGSAAEGDRVIWGGRIIETRPREAHTQVEVLDYPLDRSQRPNTARSPGARFLIIHGEFLEPSDWRADRLVTVTGTVESIRRGRIEEADYQYAVIRADDLYLWPEPAARAASPRVHLGIGVIFSR